MDISDVINRHHKICRRKTWMHTYQLKFEEVMVVVITPDH